MKRVRRAATALALAAMICMMLATAAFAAGTGSVWLSVNQDENTTALIVTDTTVTDGVIQLTYDSTCLTYVNVEVADAYVAMYAVNAEEAGVVKISWVAPGAFETDGGNVTLIQVNFSGSEEESTIGITGTAHDNQGSKVAVIGAVDTTALEETIEKAEALEETGYTEESWAALVEALESAKEVLADPIATQEEVDAAETALREAIAALKTADKAEVDTSKLEEAIKKAEKLDKDAYTKESWTVLEGALEDAKAVLADSDATQEEVDAAADALLAAINGLKEPTESPSTGDSSNVIGIIVVAAIALVALVVLIVIGIKFGKKGKYAK